MPTATGKMRALENSERKPAPGASRIGDADPREKLLVSLRVRPRPGSLAMNHDDLAATHHKNRRYLSREEYAGMYGADQADLDAVAAFAKSQGLTVVESSIPRRTVVLSGTVADVSRAFGVSMKRYQTSGETYRGYEGAVNVPENLAGIVQEVHGLDNRQVAQPLFRAAAAGMATTPLTPPQVAKLYQFPTNSAAGRRSGSWSSAAGSSRATCRLISRTSCGCRFRR